MGEPSSKRVEPNRSVGVPKFGLKNPKLAKYGSKNRRLAKFISKARKSAEFGSKIVNLPSSA